MIYCTNQHQHHSVISQSVLSTYSQGMEVLRCIWELVLTGAGVIWDWGRTAVMYQQMLSACLRSVLRSWSLAWLAKMLAPVILCVPAAQALKYGMHMVMLTVQKSNQPAWAFYTNMGYRQHPSCPERNGFDDFDGHDPGHRILFKDLRRS